MHLGCAHTNPFSNENGAVLRRIRLSSTLQRRKRSPKTESFENALQSGAIWKRCFLKTLFSSVDGENDAIWKRWRHPNRHDRAPAHSTVSIQNGGQTVLRGFSLDRNDSQSFDALAYFDWTNSQSTLSVLFCTLYSFVTFRSSSTSSSVDVKQSILGFGCFPAVLCIV